MPVTGMEGRTKECPSAETEEPKKSRGTAAPGGHNLQGSSGLGKTLGRRGVMTGVAKTPNGENGRVTKGCGWTSGVPTKTFGAA